MAAGAIPVLVTPEDNTAMPLLDTIDWSDIASYVRAFGGVRWGGRHIRGHLSRPSIMFSFVFPCVRVDDSRVFAVFHSKGDLMDLPARLAAIPLAERARMRRTMLQVCPMVSHNAASVCDFFRAYSLDVWQVYLEHFCTNGRMLTTLFSTIEQRIMAQAR